MTRQEFNEEFQRYQTEYEKLDPDLTVRAFELLKVLHWQVAKDMTLESFKVFNLCHIAELKKKFLLRAKAKGAANN